MFEHAKMQKLMSEAFTFIPVYVGLLDEDHWLVQYRDMETDVDDDGFMPENGECLARSETEEQWFFAWKLANGRLLTASAHFPEFSSYDGVDLIVEVLPATTPDQIARDWVKQKGVEGSYAEPNADVEESVADFISTKTGSARTGNPRAFGRQKTLRERLFGPKN